MWGITMLGVIDKPVTEQQFTELENGIYERMQDVQDIARNIQSDQISFLSTNLNIFLAIAALALTILIALYTSANSRIKKAHEKSAQEMEKAVEMMATAQELTEATEEKAKYLEAKQSALEELINSKKLNEKLKEVDRLTNAHSTMVLQERARLILGEAERAVGNSKNYFVILETDSDEMKRIVNDAQHQQQSIEADILMRRFDASNLVAGSGVDGEKLLKKADEVFQKAAALQQKGREFEEKYRRYPSVNSNS
jgi:hypothetical protein